MFKNSQRKTMQQWEREKKKQAGPCIPIEGNYHIAPDHQEFDTVIKNVNEKIGNAGGIRHAV